MQEVSIDMSSGGVMGIDGFIMNKWEFYGVIFIIFLCALAVAIQILKIIKKRAYFKNNEICGCCDKVRWK